MDSAGRTEAGHTVFSNTVLRFYDVASLGLSARFIYRCPMQRALALYDRHATANHLDVGVGTGAFLDRCRWPTDRPRIGLMDANPNCLEAASRRLARYRPETYRANVLEPIPLAVERFDSLSLTFLIQCLPGTLRTKRVVFENLKPLLNPGGVMFGATLLNDEAGLNWASKQLMGFYNARGIFSNVDDHLGELEEILAAHLSGVEIDLVGCAALFSGRVA
jgi:ubiquinone/menaquinone biosynthesis C-methylase UbiE